MKYRLIYRSKYLRPEEGNNKRKLIKYANEYGIQAFVIEIATGKIVYENAEQRKHNRYTRELRELCDKLKDGIPIEQLIDFNK